MIRLRQHAASLIDPTCDGYAETLAAIRSDWPAIAAYLDTIIPDPRCPADSALPSIVVHGPSTPGSTAIELSWCTFTATFVTTIPGWCGPVRLADAVLAHETADWTDRDPAGRLIAGC